MRGDRMRRPASATAEPRMESPLMSETNTRPLLSITPKAQAKARALLVKHGKEGHGFRVGVRGGGC